MITNGGSAMHLYSVLLGLATLVAMLVATKITLTYARRPDGMINQYGQAQAANANGLVVVDGYGPPPVPVHTADSDKPLWVVWMQMFAVVELAVILVVSLLTGGFGLWDIITTRQAG